MSEFEQLHLYPTITSDETLQAVFDQALHSLLKREPRPSIEARFYPYAGLSSTIRLRKGRVYARVSDILIGAPRDVLFALASILVAKLYRLKTSRTLERIYREHTLVAPIQKASQDARRRRGYKLTTTSRGKSYDLAEMFSRINLKYFDGKLQQPVLSWSRGHTKRILGHHDHVHGAIIISRTLDDPAIPRFVVEYVLYHEMLHVKHPARVVSGRTVYHSRIFREDERLFEKFAEAEKWLDKIAASASSKNRRRKKRSSK